MDIWLHVLWFKMMKRAPVKWEHVHFVAKTKSRPFQSLLQLLEEAVFPQQNLQYRQRLCVCVYQLRTEANKPVILLTEQRGHSEQGRCGRQARQQGCREPEEDSRAAGEDKRRRVVCSSLLIVSTFFQQWIHVPFASACQIIVNVTAVKKFKTHKRLKRTLFNQD